MDIIAYIRSTIAATICPNIDTNMYSAIFPYFTCGINNNISVCGNDNPRLHTFGGIENPNLTDNL